MRLEQGRGEARRGRDEEKKQAAVLAERRPAQGRGGQPARGRRASGWCGAAGGELGPAATMERRPEEGDGRPGRSLAERRRVEWSTGEKGARAEADRRRS